MGNKVVRRLVIDGIKGAEVWYNLNHSKMYAQSADVSIAANGAT